LLDDWQGGGTFNFASLTEPSVSLVPLSLTPPENIRDRFLKAGGGRIDRKEVRIRACNAMARNLPDFKRVINDSKEWAIVGFGPSINDSIEDIRKLRDKGIPIVSVNKAHDWLLERGVVPWGHILLDPKEWVSEYVQKPRKDVRYFVASQCHDKTFDALDGYPIFLWHAGQDFPEGSEPSTVLREKWPTKPWHVVPGPTTVGLRAIYLGAQLGAEKFHLFGLDSSRAAGKLHAGPKAEAPDAEPGSLKLKHKGVKYHFESNSHMTRQQFDFDNMLEKLPEQVKSGMLPKGIDITVHGYGLLPFFAAMHGLHAKPEFNADPARVGGYTMATPIASAA